MAFKDWVKDHSAVTTEELKRAAAHAQYRTIKRLEAFADKEAEKANGIAVSIDQQIKSVQPVEAEAISSNPADTVTVDPVNKGKDK